MRQETACRERKACRGCGLMMNAEVVDGLCGSCENARYSAVWRRRVIIPCNTAQRVAVSELMAGRGIYEQIT